MYGALAFPLAFAGIPIYLHAPDFYASELGVPLTTLGATLLLLRIIDAVQDPWIGRTSDLFSRWRRQIMALGIAMLGGGFWMIFHPIATWPLICSWRFHLHDRVQHRQHQFPGAWRAVACNAKRAHQHNSLARRARAGRPSGRCHCAHPSGKPGRRAGRLSHVERDLHPDSCPDLMAVPAVDGKGHH